MAAVTESSAAPPARSAALRNFGWLMADKLMALALGLLVFGVIARHYGPVGSGHYGYALALLQAALGLSLVCSAGALLPRLCRLQAGVAGALANVFVVRMGGSVVAALGTALFALVTVQDPQRLAITLILLASVPLIEPFYIAVAYWQSRNDNRPPTLSRASGLATRTAMVLAAVMLDAPLWTLALAWLLEAVVSAILQTASLRRVTGFSSMAKRVSRRRVGSFFRFGIRFLFGLALSNLFLRLDRLVLGTQLPPHEFGIYAAAMQLVDVWLQVAYLVGFAAGPAFLYASLAEGRAAWTHWRVGSALAGMGLCGLLAAAAFGQTGLQLIFGPQFAGAQSFLLAGMAFGVLVFVDQLVQLTITASNRPMTLAVKWGTGCTVCLVVQVLTLPTMGAYAGPLGLTAGMVAGWLGTWLAFSAVPRKRSLRRAGPASTSENFPSPVVEQNRESIDRTQ